MKIYNFGFDEMNVKNDDGLIAQQNELFNFSDLYT